MREGAGAATEPSDLETLVRYGRLGPFYLGQPLSETRAIIRAFDPSELSWEKSGYSDEDYYIGMFTFQDLEIIAGGPSEETAVITSFSFRPGYPYAPAPQIDYPWQHTSNELRYGSDLAQALELFVALGEPTPDVGWSGEDRNPLSFNVGAHARFWFGRIDDKDVYEIGDRYEFGEVEVSNVRGPLPGEPECTKLWYEEREQPGTGSKAKL